MVEKNFHVDGKQGGDERYAMLHQLKLFAEDIVDTVHDPLLVLGSDLKIAFANNAFYQTFNTRQKETQGQYLFDLGNRQWDIPRLRELLEKLLSQEIVFKDFEVEHEFEHLGKRIMHINARRLDQKENHKGFILLSISDVTEQTQMERNLVEYKTHLEELVVYRSRELAELNKKLLEETEWLNITLGSIGDAVIATDIEGRIILINPAAQTLVGWPGKSAVHRLLPEVVTLMDEQGNTRVTQLVEKIMASRKLMPIGRQLTLVSRDGLKRSIADSGQPILDKKGRTIGTVIVFRDITEEKNMEAKLRQSHKMESIGTLAGGIAHDFNNALFAIMGFTDLAMLEAADNSKSLGYLKKIHTSCNRAKDLVHHILTYSRQTRQEFKPVEIKAVIIEAVKLIRASLPSTIKLEVDIASNARIAADATQLHQVVYNLCTNAAHAIQDQMGSIRLSLADEQVNHNLSRLHPELALGRYVKLSVTDSGHGMAADIRDKIFDPYFTTKQLSKGTGMGLAVVHGIITEHDGFISVFSEPSQGSTFEVLLPVLEKKQAQMPDMDRFEVLQTGNERILLVDDEEQVVEMVRQMLERLGYTVTTQTSSKAALELFCSVPGRFDLVITDLTMPEMTGVQLAEKLKKIQPDLPVILCSGYNEHGADKEIKIAGISAFVQKPVTMNDLSRIARKILDRKQLERRKNERFRIREKAVAIIKSDPMEECEIVDISWGGVAISLNTRSADPKQFSEIAINLVDKGILLDSIPCKIVSEPEGSFDSQVSKRQGLEFGKLAFHQLDVLDHLIHSYTVN